MLLLKNLLFTLVVPGTVAVYLPLEIAGGPLASGAAAIAGTVLLLGGGVIYAWCVRDFAISGRGTPFPLDAPERLVVRGLYHYTRNPMYLGVLTVVAGWAVLLQAPVLMLYLLGVGACFHLVVVLYEERHLEARFGREYEGYRARVNRWLPGLGRRRHHPGASQV